MTRMTKMTLMTSEQDDNEMTMKPKVYMKIKMTMTTKMTLMMSEQDGQVATSSPHSSSSFVMANLSPQGQG